MPVSTNLGISDWEPKEVKLRKDLEFTQISLLGSGFYPIFDMNIYISQCIETFRLNRLQVNLGISYCEPKEVMLCRDLDFTWICPLVLY